MTRFVDKDANFVINPLFDGKPVQFFERSYDMVRWFQVEDASGGSILDALEWGQGRGSN